MSIHLKHLSFFAIFCTFCLLVLGGHVHNTASSLACPDWPLCYGEFFPRMEGKIFWEHSHRLLASFVGILTVMLVFVARKTAGKHGLNVALDVSLVLLFMVIIQGVFGGITVLLKLSNLVSTAHLALSMIFFLMLIYLGHITTWTGDLLQTSKADALIVPSSNIFERPSFLGIFLQIILGAFLRHSGWGRLWSGLGHSLLSDAPNGNTLLAESIKRKCILSISRLLCDDHMIVAHQLQELSKMVYSPILLSKIKFYLNAILTIVSKYSWAFGLWPPLELCHHFAPRLGGLLLALPGNHSAAGVL